jgi:ABC-type antimicrobial peptide transport system permease subunit
MFRTYFKLAYRNISRDKIYSIVNISGLAIGLASSILIFLWVQNELSYDKFHKNAAQIYRIAVDLGDSKTVGAPAGMPGGLKAEIPQIKNVLRIKPGATTLLETGHKKFEEEGVFYVDPSFMDIFSFPLVKGDRATALQRIDGIVLTQEMAIKYFGKTDPIGKIIRKDDKENLTVTGILADLPANSDLQFQFILPMASLARTNSDLKNDVWNNFNFYNYLLLDKNFDPSPSNLAKLENQIDLIFKKHDPEMKASFQLQPLTRIHLAPEILGDMPGHGNAEYVKIFFIIAVLILVVACINYMNLATARSSRRAKEIGLRKVVGALRVQLIIQFISESVFISFLSLLIALGIVSLFLPLFNELANRRLSIDFSDTRLWISLIAIASFTGLLSGSYPALFLSRFNPVKVLKGNVRSLGSNLLFRNALVVVQFMVSIVLLIGTVVIYNQLNFIQERNPGFEKANLLYVPMTGELGSKQQAFKNELQGNSLTNDFSIIADLPTNLGDWTVSVEWEGKDLRSQTAIPILSVDENFTHTFKTDMVAGRSFSNAFRTDSNGYMVNEKMLGIMGLRPDNAIGKPLTVWGDKGSIIGVVKDFNFKPVQQTIEPLVMPLGKQGRYVVVRTLPGKTKETIKALSTITQSLNPAHPFKFDFLDHDLSDLYKGEQQMSKIFNLFAALGIFISCLGLYGLSAFMAEQRTKEIGVRKVLGASVLDVVFLLSGGITKLILIAICIAIPLSWYAVNKWLSGFAYHIHVGWFIFFIASASALAIAWATVSFESIKAAIVNPIKNLRTE